MNVAILVAVVGFLSSIMGAAIGAITSYIVARKNQTATDKREALSHAMEVKRAARLILVELSRLGTAASICAKGKWWNADIAKLSTLAWEKYCPDIAPELSYDEWSAVCAAFDWTDHMKMLLT